MSIVKGGRFGVAPCDVAGCPETFYAKSLCSLHYNRQRLTGEVGDPLPRKAQAHAGWLDPESGYRYVTHNGRRYLEHRLVMVLHLGRSLWPDETVHHRNGDRSDNRLSNLELWSSWQPAGQRVEDKIAWARELLARYGEERK